jgi:hypothetical protein
MTVVACFEYSAAAVTWGHYSSVRCLVKTRRGSGTLASDCQT